MAQNRISILIDADDRATRQIRNLENQTKKSATVIKKSFTDIAVKAAAVVVAFESMRRSASAFIDAASKVEQLRTRLTVLTGTIQKGNELFEDMADLAGRVPFTYDQIMESAVNLRAVVKGGNEEVVRLMPIILDLAATTGLSVQETTSQMIRMYSAGAGAADLFRERGVLAMLGFQAGVSVSAEETMDRVIEAWEDGASRFRGATDQLSDTWAGRVSMMEDAWFKFKSEIGEAFIDSDLPDAITTALSFWTDLIKGAKDATEEYNPVLQDLHNNLSIVNDMIEQQRRKLEAPFLLNRNAAESVFNDLLEQRARILLAINERQQQQEGSEPIELEQIIIEAEAEKQVELDKVSFIEALHDSMTTKIMAFRDKEFKDEKDKAKAKAALQQQILTSRVGMMETMLAKEAENSKAAAVAFKGIQLGRSIINTSEAITEALPNIPLAALVGAIGAAEIATIIGTGFAKGTDSVPSMLTPGEMVVPRDFAGAIREGRLTLGGPGAGGGVGGDINIFIEGGVDPAGSSVEEMAEQLGFEFERQVRTARGF